jgi:succinate dehydrogenase/fumarate reductase flavoprotein subunit
MVLETDTGVPMHGAYRTYPIQHNIQDDKQTLKSTDILKKKAEKLGVTILLETPMSQLLREESGARRVVGAVAVTKSGSTRFLARKGVILATGGYSNNMDMLKEENPTAIRSCSATTSHAGNKGDGIKAATWIGAAKDDISTVMIFDRGGFPVGAPTGGDLNKGFFLHMGSQPFLKVNRKGERFCNESVPYDSIIHAAANEPGDSYFIIWDTDWKEHTRKFHTIGCSRLQPSPSGSKLLIFSEAATEQMHNNVFVPAGVIVESYTIEGLADKMGVPRETFVATVNRYNELCAKGGDEDFGKEPYRMLPLLKPPFRAGHLAGQLLCTLDGLRVDTRMRVLDDKGDPINGLFAAGNDSGGFFSGNYPEYLVGIACGRTITFGRIAGQSAAEV